MEEGPIEGVTKRHRMTVEERKELLITCSHCGQQFSRPQDLKRHENKHEMKCADSKRMMMKASERTDLPFECEKCHKRFRQKCGV